MAKSSNPITSGNKFDPYQFYRSPMFRTMAGYKFLSGTFLLCGSFAVPALLWTGEQGINGAIAVGLASIVPVTLQTIFVPRYVARMSLEEVTPAELQSTLPKNKSKRVEKGSSAPLDILDALVPQSSIRIDYFTLLGPLRTRIEKIGDIRPHHGWRWMNWKTKTGRGYYVDAQVAGPILRKVMKMIEQPDKPETWRTY